MLQIIYASRPTRYDAQVLQDIKAAVHQNCKDAGITGALISRDDLFVHLLEGSEHAVNATYARMKADPNNSEMRLLARKSGKDDARLFTEWSIVEDPEQSWIWSREDVARGAVEQAGASDAVWLFERLASLTT